ncbi:hypothetical protein C8R45DRAFT_754723, partial [Mycena sanguinolenta]
LRERSAQTIFQWVKGHSGIEGNDHGDALANQGRLKPEGSDIVDTQIPKQLLLPGARLASMTQSRAYKTIVQRKMLTHKHQEALDRFKTNRNLEKAIIAATNCAGEAPSPKQLWRAIRHKDVSRSVRFFLWMLLHDGYKVGDDWDKIQGHEYKSTCPKCGTVESMDHILTKCEENGQKQIWELA